MNDRYTLIAEVIGFGVMGLTIVFGLLAVLAQLSGLARVVAELLP